MKSPPPAPISDPDDCDDIFGPPRTYPTGYCPPKNRPSMISPKYRQKEERRKVLKISINKLKKIEDPESSLCRSVLINNTMKRLQQEARDEKLQKQQLNYPRCYDGDTLLKGEPKGYGEEMTQAEDGQQQQQLEFVVENDFDTKLAEEISTMQAKESEFVSAGARKRSYDEIDDCCMDVQDVLSQFYMPPTPRMLTCIDDDDDNSNSVIEVVDVVASKRPKLDEEADEDSNQQMNNNNTSTKDEFNCVNFLNNNLTSDSRLRYGTTNGQDGGGDSNNFSCGHASMFNELQNNVYHNLIASLET